ncbi:hypothetical protein DDB_G0292848 [Dictyostelium discoideum AX4]|uniref:GH16 domain-containing protein n=1 Tax=Dictyostelium discoideum TaxID=44689 RepID=Q54CN0_DICDI|nr:hypothetical protein DDB_G0292848 [Dictyostelium discoideum AX4]EAL60973.1 hypothetical protein DDB_G0292848 [Dictyostelium discoideum AX4]|eukprot:XP_629386.1 hypothetical protein DDB_G0292848 [Dictyostelium discoideum AX4]
MKIKFRIFIIYYLLIFLLLSSNGNVKSYELELYDTNENISPPVGDNLFGEGVGEEIEQHSDSLPPPPDTMDPKIIPSIDTSEPKPTQKPSPKPKVTTKPKTTTTKPSITTKPKTTTKPKLTTPPPPTKVTKISTKAPTELPPTIKFSTTSTTKEPSISKPATKLTTTKSLTSKVVPETTLTDTTTSKVKSTATTTTATTTSTASTTGTTSKAKSTTTTGVATTSKSKLPTTLSSTTTGKATLVPKKTLTPTKTTATISSIPKIKDSSLDQDSSSTLPLDSLDSFSVSGDEKTKIKPPKKSTSSSSDENEISESITTQELSDEVDPLLSSSSSSLATSGKITCSEDVTDTMSTDGNFIGSISSIANNPYSCTLLSENVQYTQSGTKNVMRLTLDNKGCPSKCLNNSYTCAEVESTQKLSYGTYTFNLVPSPATNSITKAYIASGGKGQYSDIFFKINGNSTNLYYGYTYFGVLVQFIEPLPGADFTLFHNYTFIYTTTGISWYFDKLLLKNKIDATYASSGARIPVPPMNYYVSLTNNQEKSISSTKLPTFAELSLFNYVSAPCLNGSSEDTNSELYTNWKTSPIGYFTSNCTSYRPVDIYNDTFQGFWKDKSNTLVINPSSQFVRTGNSIGFALNRGSDYFRLHINETVPIKRHKYLSFWLNGGNSGKQSLVLYLTYNSLRVGIANIGDYLLGGIEAGVWYKVIIPLLQIPINPSNITKIDGFMIQGTNSLFMDMVYLDDIQFSNGSVCMDLKNKTNIIYYDKGEFEGGANNTYSSGNINFKSRANFYKGYPTIEYQVSSFNNLLISLENGTLDTNLYDGIVFDLYFEPDPNYQFPGLENTESNEDILRNIPPKQLNAAICLGEETINAQLPCMGITQYVGGEFPANRWIELQIPFPDLFAFKNAMITSLSFKTNVPEHQGSLYIGKIMAAHFVPPFHEAEDSSFGFSIIYSTTCFNLSLITLIFNLIILFI